jgi:surface polysaccharide O-acyltransferase-like enzyme
MPASPERAVPKPIYCCVWEVLVSAEAHPSYAACRDDPSQTFLHVLKTASRMCIPVYIMYNGIHMGAARCSLHALSER